jgi:hypothetical protein
MTKYDFSIRTRDGQLIKRITIAGRDQEEAERKLKQMYRYCEIVRCGPRQHEAIIKQGDKASAEDVVQPLLPLESFR